MAGDDAQMERAFESLYSDYKTRCLWFLRADYKPATVEEKLRILTYIERHGDLEAFRRVAPVRKWLSQNFKQPSAG
ncbi:MAG: hypothetical protein SF187_12170 [Deltaproteobacteria bacterium]|nr:hypothetical protein [Deltaproteobacteria bacterium]